MHQNFHLNILRSDLGQLTVEVKGVCSKRKVQMKMMLM